MAYVYVSREQRLANNYRKVEALYRKGYSTDEILRSCEGLTRYDVLDILQKIYHLDQVKNK